MSCPINQVNNAGLCYNKCDLGFKGALNLCWPNCPPNWNDDGVGCTKPSTVRGVGTIPTKCPIGEENNADLCYPKCNNNYTGNGPVCQRVCPPNYKDNGASCEKPSSYGRGTGHASQRNCIISGDHGANRNGCEKLGNLWYPKCDKEFHVSGCCTCVPDCPTGWADTNVGCTKPTYGRGVGNIPSICDANKEIDGSLCYPACPANQKGVGSICRGICPNDNFTDSGTICTKIAKNRGMGTIPDYDMEPIPDYDMKPIPYYDIKPIPYYDMKQIPYYDMKQRPSYSIWLFIGIFILIIIMLTIILFMINKKN